MENQQVKNPNKYSMNEPIAHNQKIIFVKTHKTGSSTIQNIMFRFASGNGSFVCAKSITSFFISFLRKKFLFKSLKFGEPVKENNLLIALPDKEGTPILGDGKFKRNMLQGPMKTAINPDILTNHVRFSPEMESTLPNAKLITIIRDPVGQFLSAFEYYHHLKLFNRFNHGTDGVENFLENPTLNYEDCLNRKAYIMLCIRYIMLT